MSREDILQIQIANFIRSRYPRTLFVHLPKERNPNVNRRAKIKRMGAMDGVPSIMIFQPKMVEKLVGDDFIMTDKLRYCGLAIQIKIKPNRLYDTQEIFLDKLNKRRWQTAVCYDFEDAKATIGIYLNDN